MTFEGIFKYEEPDKIGKIYIGLIKEDGKENVVIKCVETYEKMDNGHDRLDSARVVIPRDLFETYFTINSQKQNTDDVIAKYRRLAELSLRLFETKEPITNAEINKGKNIRDALGDKFDHDLFMKERQNLIDNGFFEGKKRRI